MEQKYIILFNSKMTVTYSCAEVLVKPQIISDFWGVDVDVIFSCNVEKNEYILSISQDSSVSVKLNGMEVVSGSVPLSHNDLVALKHDVNLSYLLLVNGAKCTQSQFVKLPDNGSLTIGRGKNNHIIINHPAVLERHAEIMAVSNWLTFKAASNSYTYVNAQLCTQAHLNIGDCVQVLNCMVYNLGNYLCIMGAFRINNLANHQPKMQDKQGAIALEFAPVPRIFRSIDEEAFVIDSPPAKSQPKNVPFILSAGPSLTMSLGMLISAGVSIGNVVNHGINGSFITSSFMALSMLSGALLWPMLMRRYKTRQTQELEAFRTERYQAYLNEKEEEIKKTYEKNKEIISKYQLPSASRLSGAFDNKSPASFLWERNVSDEDFLVVRLGSGSQASGLTFQVTEKHFTLFEDPLEDVSRQIADRYSVYDDIPISLSLYQHNIIGIFGRPSYADAVIQNIITNLIFLHSAEQVKLLFLFPDKSSSVKYQHFSDAPHVWNREKSRRYFTYTDKDEEIVLTEVYNHVNLPDGTTGSKVKKHYVIFAWSRTIEKTALYRFVKANPSCKNVSFVFVADMYGHLPQDCKAAIECSKDLHGVYIKNQNDNRLTPFQPDSVDQSKLLLAVKELNALDIDIEADNDVLPGRVSFLDLFKVGNLAELGIANRWRNSLSHDSLATPIGAVAGGSIIDFDIHEAFHGCHGIVAGTTGSGKSEFLQSYILSMMVNYSPEDVNFVLIDFKGGDIATPFLGLPHLSAVISNLSTSVLYRAMVSLEAEQIKRQKLFDRMKAELNIDKIDINSYQKLFHSGVIKQPLPHLIIIMDEFAQFKMQHDEYMQKLINIAQIGRSLGIHLILATQKPDGVVDGQIWSNSRFKFCLKVLEREDSKSVLQRDDAAFIKNPGTAYMQVGYNEIFTKFQAGYCRAKYIPCKTYCNLDDLTVQLVDSTGNVIAEEVDVDKKASASAKTQIIEVVKELKRVSEMFGLRSNPIWLPALDRFVYSEDYVSSDTASQFALPIGILDIPTEQKQIWHLHDFCKDGNLALYGASGTGKTTLVQSLLYQGICKFTPEQFRYGIIDISNKSYSAFADTQYCIGCVSNGETEKLDSLFRVIDQELAHRKDVLSEIGCNSFNELRQREPNRLPMLVIVLENYAKFREIAYTYEERIIDVVSSGQAYGIYFIVTTNSKSGIYYKVREQMARSIAFNMVDADAYRDVLGVRSKLEPEDIRGRALTLYNGMAVELQVALPIREKTEYARLQAMKQKLMQIHRSKLQKPAEVQTQEKGGMQPIHAKKSVQPVATLDAPERFISAQKSPTTMMIGWNNQTHIPSYIELLKHKRIMLCSEKMQDFSDCCASFFPQELNCKMWTLTGTEGDGQKTVFAEIEECAEQGVLPVVVIPNFMQLYYDISDENLDLLCRLIKKQQDTVFVTCTSLNGLSDFYDTALYLDLCKNASVVLFTEGQIGEKDAVRMNRFIQRLKPSVWKRTYEGNQYLAVVEDMYTTTYFREV